MEKKKMGIEREGDQNLNNKNYGNYLKVNRKFSGITAIKLSEGLCTRSMICEIEAGRKSAGWLLRERLLRRSRVADEEYESCLNYEDGCEWRMQEEIIDYLEAGDVCRMGGALSKYADKFSIEKISPEFQGKAYPEKGDVIKRLRRQFYLGMLGMCKRLEGAAKREMEVIFEAAVRQTVPGFSNSILTGSVLCAEEINLILEYARCLLGEEAIRQCRELEQYLCGTRMEDKVKVLNYPKLVFVLCELLLNRKSAGSGEYKEVVRLCDLAIELLRKTNRAYYLFELFGIKKEAMVRLEELEPEKRNFTEGMQMEMEEWVAAFRHLYGQFGIRIQQGSDVYLYRRQDIYEAGDIIRARRRMLKISQRELQEQVTCTLETLQNMERKKCSTQPFYIQEMCTVLGLSPLCERTELVAPSFEARKLEREIRYAANDGEFDKNLEQLEELKTLIDMSDPINRQWVLRTEGMARYRLGQIGFKEYEELILQSFQCTLPLSVMEYSDEKECYLTNSEMESIYHYSLLVSDENPEEAYRRMKVVFRLEKEFEAEGREVNHIRTYELYMKYMAKLFYQLGEYDMSKHYAKMVIRGCLRTGRVNMVDSTLYTWLRNNRIQAKKTELTYEKNDWMTDLKCCLSFSQFCRNRVLENFFETIFDNMDKYK